MASIQPEDTVYSGPQAPSPKRVTLRSIRSKYSKGEPITMVTAYDYPSAVHVRLSNSHHAGVGPCLTRVSNHVSERDLSSKATICSLVLAVILKWYVHRLIMPG